MGLFFNFFSDSRLRQRLRPPGSGSRRRTAAWMTVQPAGATVASALPGIATPPGKQVLIKLRKLVLERVSRGSEQLHNLAPWPQLDFGLAAAIAHVAFNPND